MPDDTDDKQSTNRDEQTVADPPPLRQQCIAKQFLENLRLVKEAMALLNQGNRR